MSNDQLSWEKLLQSESSDHPETGVEKSVDSEAAVVKKPRKSSPRKKQPAAPAEPTEYAKKDWGKLEFSGTVVKENSAPVEVKAPPELLKVKVVTEQEVIAPLPPSEEIAEPVAEPPIFSVSQLNKNIREILEGRFPLIWLKAEISNFKAHTSGHFYFSLKDAKAQISAVMFRGFNSQLKFRPEDGMEVLVRGKITVYEPRGGYQIFCELMEPVGAGALQKAFEQLKAKLQKEGLFDEARKRPLPSLPKHIAIVTSPTGAAIRDMLNVLGRRFKGARITLVPCKVQGDQAPKEICAAIQLACQMPDVDVMIVGRGGGSIEDLWAFNDEKVARAISGSRVPVISAVGHEVDFTIADFVADLRAPTPSAAAELVVKNAADLAERVKTFTRALRTAIWRDLSFARQSSSSIAKRLVDPQRRIQDASLRCDELLQRLHNGAQRYIHGQRRDIELLQQRLGTPLIRLARHRDHVTNLHARLDTGAKITFLRKRERLELKMAVLDSLSPLKVLDRGYSMVVKGETIVTDAEQLVPGDKVTLRMCKGSIEAQVTHVEKKR